MLGGKIAFDMHLPNQNDLWTTGLAEMEEPALEPWWSMKEDDLGGRLDLFWFFVWLVGINFIMLPQLTRSYVIARDQL